MGSGAFLGRPSAVVVPPRLYLGRNLGSQDDEESRFDEQTTGKVVCALVIVLFLCLLVFVAWYVPQI